MNKLFFKITRGHKKTELLKRIILWAVILSIVFSGSCLGFSSSRSVNIHRIEAYHGIPFVLLNDNVPEFQDRELVAETFQEFSSLDHLGRTGPGIACLGSETVPTETRGSIGNIRPSGWHTVRYDDLIEDRFLYNRCHVIGYQLGGDNATPENLFTGTRYLNTNSMLYFENIVASYIRENKGSHVMYRVTPVYDGSNLVASGVQMEAYSVEDHGKGVSFNAYLYNVQPGVVIDYSDGESRRDTTSESMDVMTCAAAYDMLTPSNQEILRLELSDDSLDSDLGSRNTVNATKRETQSSITYVLNTNTKKFHRPGCSSVFDIKDKNRKDFFGTREEAISNGYVPCKRCKP